MNYGRQPGRPSKRASEYHRTSKFHTRSGYEQLYLSLCNSAKIKVEPGFKSFPDYILLCTINNILLIKDCQPFTEEELEMELH